MHFLKRARAQAQPQAMPAPIQTNPIRAGPDLAELS